ncbi:MAG: SDR family NAD(P)-dependent oxidoreductase, partial [Hyphomicrobiaceae bacterium]
ARQLAETGCNLIIVARREERLNALKQDLMTRHPGVAVDVIAMDLTARNAARHLHEEIEKWGRHVDVLINNAGFGLFGWFLERDWPQTANMIQLNAVVPGELTHLMAPGMVKRGFGRILYVSSVAGYVATPTYAAYAGAKAHILHFGEAMSVELRGSGVYTTVLSPGMTRTEFLDVSGQKATFGQRIMMMESPDVARIGLHAMMRGTPSVVPGFMNKVLVASMRLVPRSWLKWVSYFIMRNEDVAG